MPSAKTSFLKAKSLSSAQADKYSVVSSFPLGYRNREDKTNLPPHTLVTGSHDVLTNVSGRIALRKGYTLDGAASTNGLPILSSFDWQMHSGDTQHLRAGFLTSAATADGKLQFRYVNSAGTVTWTDLITSLSSVNYNFTDYWDNTNKQSLLLMVNGAASITEWTGGITTFASATGNTITKEGTTTWAQDSFYTTGTHTVVIAGIAYGATGGWTTTTLTGVAPNPSTPGYAAGTLVHQKPETTLNSAMTSIILTSNDLIANLGNQIYVGSHTEQEVYISNVDNYKSYAYANPRLPGTGFLGTLRASPTAIIPEQDTMYISAGMDQWYQVKFTLSADLTKEAAQISQLKTSTQQASQTQGLTSKIANNVIFLSNEPIVRTLGLVENVFAEPQLVDFSNPIVNDISNADFTDGQVLMHKNFVYLTAPADSTMYVLNMTNPDNRYWEAPQTLPVARLSIIDGDLYGHSYMTSETYKLFDGYNDNGNFISSSANFAFNSFNSRATLKNFNEYYVEGYLATNTNLTLGLQYNLDGNAQETSFQILGSDTQILPLGTTDNLIGKYSLGKEPLGGDLDQSGNQLPPKFRIIKTFDKVPFYEYQVSFSSSGADQQWEVLAFGPALSISSEQNVGIKE